MVNIVFMYTMQLFDWKRYALIVVFGGIAFFAKAQSTEIIQVQPPEELVIDLEHKVKRGETLYAIGKIYHCSVDELKSLNPGIGMLKPGMRIKVKQRSKLPVKSDPIVSPQLNPIKQSPRIEKPVALDLPTAPENTLDHVVLKGESIYSISKIYGVSISEIRQLNSLKSDQLSIAQKLWIPKNQFSLSALNKNQSVGIEGNTIVSTSENSKDQIDTSKAKSNETKVVNGITPVNVRLATENGVDKRTENSSGMPDLATVKSKSSLKEYEKNVTFQIGFEGIQADRSWVMLNNHKKGEVIAVINMANHKMVYCTVIGSLPEKGNKQIAISQSVADRLGVAQQNTTLQIRYVAQ